MFYMGENWYSNFVFVPQKKKSVQLPTVLSGDFGEDFLKRYHEVVKKEYYNHPELLKVKMHHGDICNQNLYSSIVSEKILNEAGLRSALFSDFSDKSILRNSELKHSFYDLGVVFRGVGHPKSKLSKKVEDQLLSLEMDTSLINETDSNGGYLKIPIVVPLSSLDVDFSSDYRFGVGVKIKEGAVSFSSPALDNKNADSIFSKFDSFGPVLNGAGGNMVVRTTESGLSRIILKDGCILDSSNCQFALSGIDNKTLVFKDE